jgi:hypothetical protein
MTSGIITGFAARAADSGGRVPARQRAWPQLVVG